MGTLQIDILGTTFTINAKEDSDYLNQLLNYYKQILKQVDLYAETQEPIQTAILAGIMLCDELYKEKLNLLKFKKQISTEQLEKFEKTTLQMIQKIDKVL